jgi:hypothetical protein
MDRNYGRNPTQLQHNASVISLSQRWPYLQADSVLLRCQEAVARSVVLVA